MVSSRLLRRVAFAIGLIALLFLLKGNVRGAEVELTLASGRTFVGTLARGTSAGSVAVRSGSATTSLTRTIQLERIRAAKLDGQVVSIDELTAAVDALPAPEPAISKSIQIVRDDRGANTETSETRVVENAERGETSAPSVVKQLVIDAQLRSWDRTSQADGLLVYVQPVDDYGQLVRAEGRIDVQLLGIEYRDFSGASLSGGKSLVQLASWSHTLKASEWTSRGYAVRLPLQAIQPEFLTDYAGYGAVVAKLVVPGAGVFEDTAELVRLRPFSPLRDLQEVQSNSRRLPGESTARGYGTAH